MAGIFTTTGSYSNLTRLELEQLRKADFFAGGKALTVGDSALLPEGIIGKGDLNAEPYLTGPSVLLDDIYSLTPPVTPGSYLGTLTQVYGTQSDTVTWYGPTNITSGLLGTTQAVVVGTTDISNGALYGIGGTLNGLTLILNVDGAGPLTLTLNTVTNAIDEPTFLAAIQALWIAATLSATQGGAAGNQLVLAAPGGGSTIVVGAGTANGLLGLTPGTTGGTLNQLRDGAASFIAAGVLAGDILLIKDKTSTGFGGSNQQSVATVSVVTATQLTLTNINSPGNFPTTQLGLDSFTYAYVIVRPGAVQLFAVPGSGPTGKEQTFLAVLPGSALHTNLSPSLNLINADRVKSIVPSQYTHDTAIDRADGVYGTPAPRVALDKLGYRIVLYPSLGPGLGPDFTKPITALNPVINPAIPAADQRFTVDYKSGAIRFSCAPQPASDINPNSSVNPTTGRLDLYAVFWAVDQSLTAGSARSLYASRSTAVLAVPAARLHFDTYGWSGGAFASVTNTGGAFGSDDILRFYDAQTVGNASINGGPYVPLTSVSANNGDQVIRVIDRAASDLFTTITAASNGLSLPQADIFVTSTAAFPTQGLLQVTTDAAVPQYVLYTNKTATSFTGCTGGTGVMSTGGTVNAAAPSLLKTANARYYCSVGNGFTSFGDFNGPHAIQAALTFIQGLGIQGATIFVKGGSFSPGAMLDVGSAGPIHLSILGNGPSSVIMPPDVDPVTIRVHAGATLYIKGVQVNSTMTTGHYAVQVTDTGRCWGEDCVFTSVDAVSLSSGSGTSASFKHCTITGTFNEAGITIEGGNSTNCNLITVDESTFNMMGAQPPFRFRALAGLVGNIEGLRCTRSRFTLNVTTNTGGGTNGNLTENTGLVDLVPSGQNSRIGNGATVQECSFEECVINTPNAPFAGDVNVLLHLVPQGNGTNGAGAGPFMQIEHFKLKSSRLTASLGDPSAIPLVLQTIPFSAVNGAKHFEMDDVTFTMIPSVLFREAFIPDDTAFDYTGGATPPAITRYGYVAVSCDKVTAKKISVTGLPQLASIGDFSLRTKDIDADDVHLLRWTDGGIGGAPSFRLIFEGYGGTTSAGFIKNVKMDGQTATAGAWSTGGLMSILHWSATADRILRVSGGRVSNFLDGGAVVGVQTGVWVMSLNSEAITGVSLDDYYVDSCENGIRVGFNGETIDNVFVTRCTTPTMGHAGSGHGIWVMAHVIGHSGIRIENNTVTGCAQEGIVVETDASGGGAGEAWHGYVWLNQNTVSDNNALGSNTQIVCNSHTLASIFTNAMHNNCGGVAFVGKMRLLKNGGALVTDPDGTLAQNLRGWQTLEGTTRYVSGSTMLFNDAIFLGS